MALSITSIVRQNGPACSHLTITVDHEGTPRTMTTSFGEIDTMFDALSPAEHIKMLVILWAKYRRVTNRPVVGVGIA